MVEYKFTAKKLNGQIITGSLAASTSREGKEKIQKLADKNQVKIVSIEKKIYIFI